jgi:feruloyl esterase
MRIRFAVVTIAAMASLSFTPAEAQETATGACVALNRLTLTELSSIEAATVPPGPFDLPATRTEPARAVTLPAHCRVRGVVEPAIRFEVWLPEASAWNGRFQAVGGGGLAGNVSYSAMTRALQGGYATASTDTGHVAPDVEWLGDAGRLRDYGYRAINEMTAKAKAAINAYYGRPADYDYFNGCSTGGRQGLMEAQRFPDDYDGIVSGAPVNYFVGTHTAQLWMALAAKEASDESILSETELDIVSAAAVAHCDATDGVTDGVIEDPRSCDFDPGECTGVAAGNDGPELATLRADQVMALRKIYAGPLDPRTGARLHPGFMPSGEAEWNVVTDVGLVEIPREFFTRSVFKDPSWDWRTFDFGEDFEQASRATAEILDATNPDLSAFRSRGGKLIVYHGWNDQVIPPAGSIKYFESVEATLAARPNGSDQETRNFFRLFMVPGMAHCRGGAGTSTFDAQKAIEAWVERGIAPGRIEASRRENDVVTRTRPLCPYPQTAQYDGTGDTNDTANFVCAE